MIVQIEILAAQYPACGKNQRKLLRRTQPVFTEKAEAQILDTLQAYTAVTTVAESNSQAAATFGATRTDNGTTSAGAHAHEEAVGALAAHDRRLIGAFHDNLPKKWNRRLQLFK